MPNPSTLAMTEDEYKTRLETDVSVMNRICHEADKEKRSLRQEIDQLRLEVNQFKAVNASLAKDRLDFKKIADATARFLKARVAWEDADTALAFGDTSGIPDAVVAEIAAAESELNNLLEAAGLI